MLGCLTMVNRDKGYGDFLQDARGQVSKLEKALDGQPAEVIARVRAYARAFDVEDDDEIFALMAAFGYLTILVEDAPEHWRALFDEVQQDLDDWAERNQRSFRQLEGYAKAADELAGVLRKAIGAIEAANTSRRALKQEVLKAIGENSALDRQLAKALGSRLNQAEQQLSAIRETNHVTTILAGVGVGVSVLLLLVGGVTAMQLSDQNRQLRQAVAAQQTELGWLLDKANRAECINGIKPRSDPQCQQYQ